MFPCLANLATASDQQQQPAQQHGEAMQRVEHLGAVAQLVQQQQERILQQQEQQRIGMMQQLQHQFLQAQQQLQEQQERTTST